MKVTPHTKCKLRLLKFERIKDFLLMEHEFCKTQEEIRRSDLADTSKSDEVKKMETIRGKPMNIGTLEEQIDDGHAIVSSTGNTYVSIMSFVDQDLLEPGATVLLHKDVGAVVGVLEDNTAKSISVMKVNDAPAETYAEIGGLDEQIQEIKEAVELPLTNPELYEEVGIAAPKGCLLYGEPGTGKTLLAKAVANATSATFLHVVGSELIQKYVGEGPKLVRELFRSAQSMAPSIVFIDEIDAVGTKRFAQSSSSSGEREVERTMMELLNQLDGFDQLTEVKVIMATNEIESLDPALIRPGRIDRKIHFPLPTFETKKKIFEIHTKKMSLDADVNLSTFIHEKDQLSGADIKAICTEAGLLALRERRMKVKQDDFQKALENVIYKKTKDTSSTFFI